MRALLSALLVAILAGAAQSPAGAQSVDCAAPGCEAQISDACLTRHGAADLSTSDRCAGEQAAYVACLRTVAETCASARTQAEGAPETCAPEDARQIFAAIAENWSADELNAFAQSCAGTPQAAIAAARATRLRQTAKPAAPAAETALLGEWRLLKLVEQRNDRFACSAFMRLRKIGGSWRFAAKSQEHAKFLESTRKGRLEAGEVRFEKGGRFRLDGEDMIFTTKDLVCRYLKHADP